LSVIPDTFSSVIGRTDILVCHPRHLLGCHPGYLLLGHRTAVLVRHPGDILVFQSLAAKRATIFPARAANAGIILGTPSTSSALSVQITESPDL
jgi:hypothetical protein